MSTKPTNFVSYPWSASAAYKTHDFVDGIGTNHEAYYYATQDNTNQNPLNNWAISSSSWSRVDGLVTVTLGSSISPALTRGSFVEVTGMGALNFTGCIFDGSANTIKYFNPGPDDSGSGTGGVRSNLNPAWSSGFMWAPSYAGSADTEERVVKAQFGDGYSQRQRNGLNNNMETLSLTFENRTDREVDAISNFVQEKGGVDPVKISCLGGKHSANCYYTLNAAKRTPQSFNRNSLTVTATQVFDPL